MQSNQLNSNSILEIKGMVSHIRFTSMNTGYVVFDLKIEPGGEVITATGTMDGAIIGDCIICSGKFITTKKYGTQFESESICRSLPDNENNMLIYLKSGMIKGIGGKTASRLIKTFGKDIIWVLNNDPSCIKKMRGIGKKTYDKITESWKSQQEVMSLIHTLYEMGLPTKVAIRIQKKYKEKALSIVRQNPYQLLLDIKGLNFEFVDKIAHHIGIPAKSISRIQAGMRATLIKKSLDGHTYIIERDFLKATHQLLKINVEIIKENIDLAVISGFIVSGSLKCLDFESEDSYIALPVLHDAEIDIAKHLSRLMNAKKKQIIPAEKIEKLILKEEKISGITLSIEQKEIVKRALNSKVFIIYGGPGTGKTTITRFISQIIKKRGYDIMLAAPTGRAAKKLSEVTGLESSTIHRLLNYQPENESFAKNKDNKLECKTLLLDEHTMVSAELMRDTLYAIDDQCSLIVVGDYDQLLSIGPGAVFKNMIESGVINAGKLTSIRRQERYKQSMIIENANLVNNGQFPSKISDDPEQSDFFLFSIYDSKRLNNEIIDLVTKKLPSRLGIKDPSEIQVITPTNKKINGVFNLNKKLQETINPKTNNNCPDGWTRPFRINDKVIQTANNYELEIYNGDIGRVIGIDCNNDEMKVDFDGNIVEYSTSDMIELMLAYAITIHKSQGSEYPFSIVIMDNETPCMQKKQLLFTGMTRGKKLSILVGHPDAIQNSVRDNSSADRKTTLKSWLIKLALKY